VTVTTSFSQYFTFPSLIVTSLTRNEIITMVTIAWVNCADLVFSRGLLLAVYPNLRRQGFSRNFSLVL
jgi:hypothetical protein